MHPDDPTIRDILAAALRNDEAPWPAAWDEVNVGDDVIHGAIFHGVAGLLAERPDALSRWPASVQQRLRELARDQAMWELRHRQLLSALLAEFAAQSIPCLVMKGTALAYDLYANPATRSRGDTDLLVGPADVKLAKAILARLGYVGHILGGVTPEFSLQQAWTTTLPDGGSHSIDLHWQVMNAPSLQGLLHPADCFSHSQALPRLSQHARTMDRPYLMIHAALHRAMQCNAPYFVAGRTYFDPGRLIWLWDLHLLAGGFSDDDWTQCCALADEMGVSRPCVEALLAAQAAFGTELPATAIGDLEKAAGGQHQSPYFTRSHSLSRAWRDIRSTGGLGRKLRYMLSRIVTTEPFLRDKYPAMAGRSLPWLYGRRFLDLFLGKPNAG